jgi:hypothetical protein
MRGPASGLPTFFPLQDNLPCNFAGCLYNYLFTENSAARFSTVVKQANI